MTSNNWGLYNTATQISNQYVWTNHITISGSATTTSNCTWGQWLQTGAIVTNATWSYWAGEVHQRKETKRQRVTRLAAERQYAEQQRQAMLAQQAGNKAEKLLIEHLTPAQAQSLAGRGYFDVQIGDKTYRIHRGTHGNVRLLDGAGREKTLYCVQPGGVPTADAMLAQKLHLEANEQEFLRVANARAL